MADTRPEGMQPGVRPPATLGADAHGHAGRGHEQDDIAIGSIVKFIGSLMLSAVVIYVVLGGMWRWFRAADAARAPSVSAWSAARELPPTPRLQVTPEVDLDVWLQKEHQRLASYGWMSQGGGQVHIPIDRAMDLIAERGLPARAAVVGQRTTDPKSPLGQDKTKQQLKGTGSNPNEPQAQ